MNMFGILILVMCAVNVARAGNSLSCLHCDAVHARSHCSKFHKCHKDEACGLSIYRDGDRHEYRFQCQPIETCLASPAGSILGKRSSTDQLVLECSQCCPSSGCNRDLCYSIDHTPSPTFPPVTVTKPGTVTQTGTVSYTVTHAPLTQAPTHGTNTQHHHTCKSCQGVRSYSDCHHYVPCDGHCYAEVHHVNGGYIYNLSCKTTSQMICKPVLNVHLIGKRQTGANEDLQCMRCCDAQVCKTECSTVDVSLWITDKTPGLTTHRQTTAGPTPKPTTQTKPTTTTATITQPTVITAAPATPMTTTTSTSHHQTTLPGFDPQCHDREEDGLTCASLDAFGFCHDPSTFAYFLAHEKCKMHCGFCTPTIQTNPVKVTPPPANTCADFEQDGFTCVNFSLFGLCTDKSGLAQYVAQHKCKKHCGICQSAGGSSTILHTTKAVPTTTASTSTTAAPATTPTTTTTRQTTTTKTTAPTTTHATVPQTQGTTAAPCLDLETSIFSCKAWKAQGYCAPDSGMGYDIAILRCRRYCGFC